MKKRISIKEYKKYLKEYGSVSIPIIPDDPTVPLNRDQLQYMINHGYDLSEANVSEIEDFSGLFSYKRMISPDISDWNITNASVSDMFVNCGIEEEKPTYY